jgi:hypothetical protein
LAIMVGRSYSRLIPWSHIGVTGGNYLSSIIQEIENTR